MSERATAEAARAAALQALDWVRERWPDAEVTTTLIPSDEALVPVSVDIEVRNGPAGAGHGVAAGVEEAEDRAIVRAAETLGYRVERAPVAEPRPVTSEPAAPPPPLETVQHSASPPLAGRSAQLGPPVVMRPRAQNAAPAPASTRPVRAVPPPDSDPWDGDDDTGDPDMEDVSWTAFWKWARAQGFDTGEAVAKAIGRPIQGLTPREVRDLLRTRQ
jgi:hypothetical protein